MVWGLPDTCISQKENTFPRYCKHTMTFQDTAIINKTSLGQSANPEIISTIIDMISGLS